MRTILAAIALACYACAWAIPAAAQTQSCARPVSGSLIAPPPDLYSTNGTLSLSFNYVSNVDAFGRTLYCYVTPDGLESPTLHVNPGDTLQITLTNRVPASGAAMRGMAGDLDVSQVCGDQVMTAQSVNLHFHGANVSPSCGSDEVIHTLVNPGSTFTYTVKFPKDEPPGLYWYHPHVHGISSRAVEGGATGVIVVEGIEKLQPKVAGLPERILVVRDQAVGVQAATTAAKQPKEPSWDISLNYVPVSYPQLIPSVIRMAPGAREFWRVANTSADTVADLQLKYDGVVQTVQLVALDGVPVGSQDGTAQGKTLNLTDVLMPPAGRAEFIVTGPPLAVKHATLTTARIDTGPVGDIDTKRVLADIRPALVLDPALPKLPQAIQGALPAPRQRFEGLDTAQVSARRKLIFSEFSTDPGDPEDGLFFITVAGALPKPFDPNAPAAITTTQGAVEDWTIENQSSEVHEFHMHQIHFQLRAVSGVPVDASERQIRDTIQVPYWTGKGPYPSVTLRMDFRGDVVGDFVYHCHILDHEDRGMMAIIRVLPKDQSSTVQPVSTHSASTTPHICKFVTR